MPIMHAVSDVAVVGAGAVGLTLAGRLAQHGASVDLFEADAERARIGSKAICMQRETLEIWARLGVGERVAQRGIQWRVGRTYFRGRRLFEVHLPGDDEHFPPFVNISQSEVEELLEARAIELGVRIHRGHRLTALTQDADGVSATFDTDGRHRLASVQRTWPAPMAPTRPSGTASASASPATASTTASSSPMSAPSCRSRTSATSTSTRPGTPVARSSSIPSPTACGGSTGRSLRRPMRTSSARRAGWSGAFAPSSVPTHPTSSSG